MAKAGLMITPDIKVIYLNKQAIEKNQKYFNKNFYRYLIQQEKWKSTLTILFKGTLWKF